MSMKKWREKKGLTQAALAWRLGYSTPQFISNIERGVCRIPISKFRATCKILGIKVEDLIALRVKETEERLNKIFKII